MQVLYNGKILTFLSIDYEYGTSPIPFLMIDMFDEKGVSGAMYVEDILDLIKTKEMTVIHSNENTLIKRNLK